MMNDNEIRQLLETMEVRPSGRCWDAIANQLATSTAATAVSATAKVASKAALPALSTAAKVAVGVVVASVVTTTAILIGSGKTEISSPESPVANNVVATADSTAESTPLENADFDKLVDKQLVVHQKQRQAAAETEERDCLSAAVEFLTNDDVTDLLVDSYNLRRSSIASAPDNVSAETNSQPAMVANSVQPTVQPSVAEAKPAKLPSEVVGMTDFSDPVLESMEDMTGVDFSQPVSIVIPNVITPNGDGVNDFFIITGIEQCERNRLLVRQRNGAVVFQTLNYRNDWGATHVPAGTYFYQFCYTIHGIEEVRTGTLTILR